jgi:AcrR family transcriptional regulator
VKEAIRNFIIEKAKSIFEEKGFSNTTIEEIASAAQISKPTLYNYFSGKDDVFRAVVDLGNTQLNNVLEPILNGDRPFPQNLKMLIRALLEHVRGHKGIMKIVFYESRMFLEAIDNEACGLEKLFEEKNKRERVIRDFIQKGMEEGYVRTDMPPKLLGLFFNGIVGEYILAHLMAEEMENEYSPDYLADKVLEILANGMLKKDCIDASE